MAKAYNFSLQKVLDVRKHIENQKSVELSKAKQKLEQEKNKLNKLNSDKESVLNKDHEKSADIIITLNDLKVTNTYIHQLNHYIHDQKNQVDQSNQKVQHNRENLLSAMKDKKAVEMLKERYTTNYKKMRNLEAGKKESEVALRIAMKNKDKQ